MIDTVIRNLQRLAASGDNLAARRLRLELKRSGRGIPSKLHLPWKAQFLSNGDYTTGYTQELGFAHTPGYGSGRSSYLNGDGFGNGDGYGYADGFGLAYEVNDHLSARSVHI